MKKNTQPKIQHRMSAEERRADIIQSVIPVFAEKGFSATKTKDLAKAANVSEAMLYRHFPSKEALYEEIQKHICAIESSIHEYVYSLEPGAESIVKMFYLLFKIIYEPRSKQQSNHAIHRLMVWSLLEDGAFIKAFNEPRFEQILPYLKEYTDVARLAGDMVDSPLTENEQFWFPHHFAMGFRTAGLPLQEVFSYQVGSAEKLLHAVWFCLRGIGVKDDVIARTLKPDILDPVTEKVLMAAGMRDIR
ncbi:MAG: TetR/AcrR family transcriptional regulator [Desulfotalea sp.]